MGDRISKTPVAHWEIVTPEKARFLLERNKNFRKMTPSLIQKIANDINNGRRNDNNGEAIKINTKDNVVDGQYRLQAVVQTGKPIKTLVIYGITSDQNLDSGKSRTASEYLSNQGEISCNNLTAALRLLIRWEMSKLGDTNNYTSSTSEIIDTRT